MCCSKVQAVVQFDVSLTTGVEHTATFENAVQIPPQLCLEHVFSPLLKIIFSSWSRVKQKEVLRSVFSTHGLKEATVSVQSGHRWWQSASG